MARIHPGESNSLPAAFERSAEAHLCGLTFHEPGGVRGLSPKGLVAAAERGARCLAGLGVSPGDRVGVMGPNTPEWAVSAASIWRAGAVVVPLPYALLGTTEALAERVAAMRKASACGTVLAHPDWLDALSGEVGFAWHDLPDTDSRLPPMPSARDLAVVQFSSGSTGAPKGVMLEHGAILAALRISSAAQGLEPGREVLCGWLPFFHDYGLFGFMVRSMVLGLETHILTLEQFAEDPACWWRLVGKVGATFTAGPPSAWAMTARAVDLGPDGVDLSSLNGCMMAAEMIDAATVERVKTVGGRFGLRSEAVSGAYGLAEATLGVAAMPMGSGVRIDNISLSRFVQAQEAVPVSEGPAKRVVSCGRPMDGIEVTIRAAGRPLGERDVGEIWVRGPSLMRGYVGGEVPAPFDDGWLRTGDLGYLADGHLYLTGREKDIIIVMGRNYSAEDLEWAAGTVAGVRPGRCVAFSKGDGADGEPLVLVEPTKSADLQRLRRSVKKAVVSRVGAIPVRVVVVAPGSIPKTSSGKLRRSAAQQAYRDGLITAYQPDGPTVRIPTGAQGAPR